MLLVLLFCCLLLLLLLLMLLLLSRLVVIIMVVKSVSCLASRVTRIIQIVSIARTFVLQVKRNARRD